MRTSCPCPVCPVSLGYKYLLTLGSRAILTMYKGAGKGNSPMILRSYDSRREPPPEFDCKIWEAGRATCSIGLAFKPIQIGQSVFHDDGAGPFNPGPEALDEAVLNEWPGREVGVMISVGTGKRPRGSDSNQQMWYEGFLGEFAEARRKLIAKIEGCEATHEKMMKEHLPSRNVNIENYYRFNVEMGVGEFGMNEWHRLADISSGTRQYLRRPEEQKMIQAATSRLAKIKKAHQRLARLADVPEIVKSTSSFEPFAVELPGDAPDPSAMPPPPPPLQPYPQHHPPPSRSPPSRQSYDSGIDNLHLPTPSSPSPRNSGDRFQPSSHSPSPASRADQDEPDRFIVSAPTPAQFRHAAGADKIAIMSPDEHPRPQNTHGQQASQQQQQQQPQRIPPPLPPKTPLPEHIGALGRPPTSSSATVPYPLDDEPPPVNMAKKPTYRGR